MAYRAENFIGQQLDLYGGSSRSLMYIFCFPVNETPENGPCWLNGIFPYDSNLYL